MEFNITDINDNMEKNNRTATFPSLKTNNNKHYRSQPPIMIQTTKTHHTTTMTPDHLRFITNFQTSWISYFLVRSDTAIIFAIFTSFIFSFVMLWEWYCTLTKCLSMSWWCSSNCNNTVPRPSVLDLPCFSYGFKAQTFFFKKTQISLAIAKNYNY